MESRSFGLDVLRSVSVWMVMLAHIAYWFAPQPGGSYVTYIAPLMLGVEPFFVLGGFLAAYSFYQLTLKSNNGKVTTKDGSAYLARRWRRTLPNYFLFLLVYFIAFSLTKPDFSFDWRYLVFAQNLFWLAPSFFSVSWSLATQEWFYLLLPILVIVASKILPIHLRRHGLLISAFALIAASFAARYIFLNSHPVESLEGDLRRIAAFRLDSVAVGVAIGFAYFSRREWAHQHRGLLFALGITSVIALCYLRRQPWFYSEQLIQLCYYPVFSLMLGLCLPLLYTLPKSGKGWIVRTFESTSTWSYSIYLSHVFFKDGMYLVAKKMGMQFEGGLGVLLLAVVWVAATYLTSALIYRFFEKPWLSLGKRPPRSK